MRSAISDRELQELMSAFSDIMNYDSDDPTDPIDPLTYREPGGDACIHIAAHRGDLRALQLLVKSGMDVNSIGEMGCTPLHYAIMNGHREVIQFLLASGASTSIRNDFGDLPIPRKE